jgi:hypothetical protein
MYYSTMYVICLPCPLLATKHAQSNHVDEVLGFGVLWICRSMPTSRRNMLSPSSGAEFTT